MLTRREFIKKSGFVTVALSLFPSLAFGNTKILPYPVVAPQNPVNSLKEDEKVINDTYLTCKVLSPSKEPVHIHVNDNTTWNAIYSHVIMPDHTSMMPIDSNVSEAVTITLNQSGMHRFSKSYFIPKHEHTEVIVNMVSLGEYGLKPQDNYNITPGYVNLGAKVSPLKFKVL